MRIANTIPMPTPVSRNRLAVCTMLGSAEPFAPYMLIIYPDIKQDMQMNNDNNNVFIVKTP